MPADNGITTTASTGGGGTQARDPFWRSARTIAENEHAAFSQANLEALERQLRETMVSVEGTPIPAPRQSQRGRRARQISEETPVETRNGMVHITEYAAAPTADNHPLSNQTLVGGRPTTGLYYTAAHPCWNCGYGSSYLEVPRGTPIKPAAMRRNEECSNCGLRPRQENDFKRREARLRARESTGESVSDSDA